MTMFRLGYRIMGLLEHFRGNGDRTGVVLDQRFGTSSYHSGMIFTFYSRSESPGLTQNEWDALQ